MLSRLVITFLPRSKHLLISWLPSLSAVILEPKADKATNRGKTAGDPQVGALSFTWIPKWLFHSLKGDASVSLPLESQ